MKNDNEFVNEIWNKFDLYSSGKKKDKFFSKHLYKNTDYKIRLRTFLTFIVIFLSMIGVVYASGKIIEKFTQKDIPDSQWLKNYTTSELGDWNFSQINEEWFINGLRNVYEDWDFISLEQGFYYRKITSYSEYISFKEHWDLEEMTQKDFENYFILIIDGNRLDTCGLYVSNVSADENTLCIDLNIKRIRTKNTIICLKIENSLNRDNIEIINHPNIPDMSKKYANQKTITTDYTEKQAIEDGCFVISQNKVISEDKNMLDKFIKNTKNGIEGVIRIYEVSGTFKYIRDIEYKNGRYNEAFYSVDSGSVIYFTGIKIERVDNSIDSTYYIVDEFGQNFIVSSYRT